MHLFSRTSAHVAYLVTFASVLLPVSAVFEDEAYSVDFGYTLLGLPVSESTFFHRPRQNEKASLLYTLSDAGVLGAVNPGTGDVVWRQLLDTTLATNSNWTGGSIQANGEDIVTVVGGIVTAWDAMNGKVKWTNGFLDEGRDVEVLGGIGASSDGDVLSLFETASGVAVTRRLDRDTGNVVWEHISETGDVAVQVSTNVQSVFVVTVQGTAGAYKIKVTSLDIASGKKLDSHVLPSSLKSVKDILFVGANSAAPIIAWTEKDLTSLKVNILGTRDAHDLRIAAASESVQKFTVHAPRSIQARPHFLVHSQGKTAHFAEVYHIDLKRGTITEAYHLPKLSGSGAFSTSEIDANVFFTRNTEDEAMVVNSISHAVLARWDVSGKKTGIVHAVSEVVRNKADSYAIRAAVVTSDDNWVLIHNGSPAWTRPEGLSKAVAATWAELPEGETLAKELEVEAHSNVVSAYIHRVTRHIHDLQHLPVYISTLPRIILDAILPGDTPLSSDNLIRDTFGFRKLVILATSRGRVYGLDAANQGEIIWSVKAFDIPAGEKWDVKAIWAENKKGQVTIRGGEGEYIVIKSATGANVETMWRGSWPPLQSSAVVDSPSGQWILPIGMNGEPGHVPAEWAPKGTIVVRGVKGEVKGLAFKTKAQQAVPYDVWTFRPRDGETILSVSTRPPHDPVASIGHVLADRTVLYKYINPNVVLITTTLSKTSSVSFYVLDSTSGSVLYSTNHGLVDLTKPITSTLSGNTFAYTLFTDVASGSASSSSKGYKLFVSELFESELSNDRGPLGLNANYSALLPSEEPFDQAHLPHVKTISFLIPEPVSFLTSTSTLQGITTKSLLLTLPESNSIMALPRHIVDARRPAGRPPTKGEQEEGLMPYTPIIEFDPKFAITHKREVVGIRGVVAEPALIESTSLVFAFGIDVFGTRVAPSGAFDVLGKGFNKVSLVCTVLGLGVATAAIAPLVRRKIINGRWRTA